MHARATLLATLLAVSAAVRAQNLSDSQTAKVKQRLADGAKQSWELGTRMQALLELDTPSYSVLTVDTDVPPSTKAPSSLGEVTDIAQAIVANRSASNNNAQGAQPLMADGSAADPASNGVGVLLANWTGADGGNYAGAAADQLNFLLYDVPKQSDGAISHRTDYVQLWSDFMYMVPPFLAYYGVTTNNKTLVEMGYNQIKLYRNNLRDAKMGGLWKHVINGPTENDPGYWSTGNGWAAMGMLRVLGTIKGSSFASAMESEQSDLLAWVQEIHGGMYKRLPATNLFHNYPDAASTFPDASSTALLAASVYRAALLGGAYGHLAQADACRRTLFAQAANGSWAHFDGDGWLTPVVDPHAYGVQGAQSPEAQAFVLMLQSAYRDWTAAGSPGNGTKTSAALALRAGAAGRGWAVAAVAAGALALVAL